MITVFHFEKISMLFCLASARICAHISSAEDDNICMELCTSITVFKTALRFEIVIHSSLRTNS